nr:hypothetical protein [Dinoroseobacter sp.]
RRNLQPLSFLVSDKSAPATKIVGGDIREPPALWRNNEKTLPQGRHICKIESSGVGIRSCARPLVNLIAERPVRLKF